MYSTTDFRKGLKIELGGQPYIIVDFAHVNPGKGAAFTRTKLKNLLTRTTLEKTFKSGDKVVIPDLMVKKMQFMYRDSEGYHVMDTKTYDQLPITEEQLGDRKRYMQESMVLEITFFNQQPIVIETPNFVVLEVVKTDPGVRGDTASGGSKPATLITGAVVNVPFHINEGDKIKVDTRNNTYLEKV